MRLSRLHWMWIVVMLAALVVSAHLYTRHLEYNAMHAMPQGLYAFKLTDPLPVCDRWKQHMPSTRDPDTYRLYIEARKLWRSKIAWQMTHAEASRILNDVKLASKRGDWGARALLAHFYLNGLGPMPSNHVLDPDEDKAVEIARSAAAAGQPWGFYDLGVAHEHGYGGAAYDEEIAWAYYYKAAQLGSPDAQMALASAYGKAGRPADEENMLRCAFQQGHGPAALELALNARINRRYQEALHTYQEGVKFGSPECASTLNILFTDGTWIGPDENKDAALKALGISADQERAKRYLAISDALAINPDLKFSRLDRVLPLPLAKVPKWHGIEDALDPDSSGPPTY